MWKKYFSMITSEQKNNVILTGTDLLFLLCFLNEKFKVTFPITEMWPFPHSVPTICKGGN